ncbi:hypothetical protein SEVIR_1G316601v4 [Setaria viridis]
MMERTRTLAQPADGVDSHVRAAILFFRRSLFCGLKQVSSISNGEMQEAKDYTIYNALLLLGNRCNFVAHVTKIPPCVTPASRRDDVSRAGCEKYVSDEMHVRVGGLTV